MVKRLSNICFVLIAYALVGCNAGPNQTNIELIQNMMDQESIKAQDWDNDRPDKRANLYPPKGTVPIGFKPYKYGFDVLKAEAELVNPIVDQTSGKLFEKGHKLYQIKCAICHGESGKGDGPISKVEKLMRPIPNIVTDVQKKYKDGRLFHIITMGQGLMGPYAYQIKSEEERWAVVNYIRSLQKAAP